MCNTESRFEGKPLEEGSKGQIRELKNELRVVVAPSTLTDETRKGAERFSWICNGSQGSYDGEGIS